MKQTTKWFATFLVAGTALIVANLAQAQTQVISDFDNFTLPVTYGNWNEEGWLPFNGGAGIVAPTLTSGATSFTVNAGGYGSGHHPIAPADQVLLNSSITPVTLSLTLNSPSKDSSWLGVKFLLSDNQGNYDVWYGAYTGMWGVDNGSWANGNVGTATWSGNTLTMTVPLTAAMLAGVQTGNSQITGFNLVIDPAVLPGGVYDITYNSLTMSAVPEPTSAALLLLGAGGLLIVRRKNR